jgi:hypothetical protein
MKKIFDYIGYRIFRLNRMRWNVINDRKSVLFYIIIQIAFLLDILAVIIRENYTLSERKELKGIIYNYTIIIGIILYFLNQKYFKNKYAEFDNLWGKEVLGKRISRGLIISIVLIVISMFSIFYTVIRGNPLG